MTNAVPRNIAKNGDLRNKKDPEEQGRSKRRTFEAGFKLRVLDEWDRADSAERAAILRREGIYSSTIADWKRQKREGTLVHDGSRRPDGRGGPTYAEVDRLRRENAKLQEELAKVKFVIEVQGKSPRSWRSSRRARIPTRTRPDPRRGRQRAHPRGQAQGGV